VKIFSSIENTPEDLGFGNVIQCGVRSMEGLLVEAVANRTNVVNRYAIEING